MPVYEVTTPQGKKLVDAANAATAINHVTKPGVTATPLKTSELAAMLRADPLLSIEVAETKPKAEKNIKAVPAQKDKKQAAA